MTSSSLDSGQIVSSSVVAIMTPAPPRLRSASESSSLSASSRGSTGSVVSGGAVVVVTVVDSAVVLSVKPGVVDSVVGSLKTIKPQDILTDTKHTSSISTMQRV